MQRTVFAPVRYALVALLILASSLRMHAADDTLKPLLAPGDGSPVVLFFIASDCPISNRMIPEMQRLQHEFAAQHVHFWFVYPNVTETAATIRMHRRQYSLSTSFLTDVDGRLAHLTGAKATPEAAVLIPQDASLHPAYVGRIDDRFLSLGVERPTATRHDLEAAISSVLSGRPAVPPGGPSVGCFFVTSK